MGYKKWLLPQTDISVCDCLQARLGVGRLTAEILAAKGYKTAEQAEEFLSEEGRLADPFTIKDMKKAADRILSAIDEQERIVVYGDYDADGVTATAILLLYLETAGADVTYYIPSREDEGYGMNRNAVRKICDDGARLIITVDNGITALDEIAYAKKLGVDVVVTDHHKPKASLPDAVAVVDPHREDCHSTFKDLCGAGLALKLVAALCGDYEEAFDFCAELAAIGTIADIVPLRGENRAIVKAGLSRLEVTQNLGLAALNQICGLDNSGITSQAVAYSLVPRINAAGRLGLAEDALRLLITDDYEEAELRAEKINANNDLRKELEQDLMQGIEELMTQQPELIRRRVIVLARQGFHPGVAGIAAAKLVDRFAKPCFIICMDGETAKGSARSVTGYPLFEALCACDNLLTRYGGHDAAGGFTLASKDIRTFAEQLETYSRQYYSPMPVHAVQIDVVCKPKFITVAQIKELAVLEPFGCENEPVRFAFNALTVKGITPIGGGKHLRISFTQREVPLSCVYFGVSAENFAYGVGDCVDIICACDVNVYQGREGLTIKIRDIRPSSFQQDLFFTTRELCDRFENEEELSPAEAELIYPTREEIAMVYRKLSGANTYTHGLSELAATLSSNYGKTKNAVSALSELGLVNASVHTAHNNECSISVVKGAPKANLADSQTLQRLERVKSL